MPFRQRAQQQMRPRGATVPIKRVIRRDGLFVCGVCRKAYQREAEADHCLVTCLSHWLKTAPPINEVTDGTATQFRCGFCKRVYTRRTDAQACADACRTQTQKSVADERRVGHQRAPTAAAVAAPVKAKAPKFGREHMHKFLRDGRKLICRKCGKEHPTLETVIACFDAHVAPPKAVKAPRPEPMAQAPRASRPVAVASPPVLAAVASLAPAPAAAPEKAPKAADDAHKFRRDGARYICRNCSAKYFTRGDVVACHDAH